MNNKFESILFWILILLIIGVAVWKLVGSPTDTAALIAIALFVASSEVLIWKNLFKIDKKNTVGFMKISNDLSHIKRDVNSINEKINALPNKKGI